MSAYLLLSALALALAMAHTMRFMRWLAGFDALRQRTSPLASSDGTGITVIIPVRNEGTHIAALLQDLHEQARAQEQVEVLVVDDHSTDDTVAIVQGMQAQWPALRLERLTNAAGKKAAITLGVEAAAHDRVVVTDADVRCGPEWLAALRTHWATGGGDLLLMPVRTRGKGGWLGLLQEEEQAILLAVAAASAEAGRPLLANGANMAFQRGAFRRVGGYTGDAFASGDDMFLLARMKRAGLGIRFLLDRRLLVTTEATDTWRGFLSQRLRWAGKMRAIPGSWKLMPGMVLPVLLLVLTIAVLSTWRIGEGRFLASGLLILAWTFWAMPILRLSRAAWSFLEGEEHRHSGVRILCAACAFSCYAPLIALLGVFLRPRWKGRQV